MIAADGRLHRRAFLVTLAVAAPLRVVAAATEAGRRLDFEIRDEFPGASVQDVEAVIRSAAGTIWSHCRDARWQTPGFHIYRDTRHPITLNEHRADGRIAIGLNTEGAYWAQYAFQFAHEFVHALAGHSNDWRGKRLGGTRPNHWLEEALCEVASLFALRAMARIWEENPPYSNWRSFAPRLAEYAAERMEKQAEPLPAGQSFAGWLRAQEPSLREDATQRAKNLLIAKQLLPLFEAEPEGWEALTFRNLREPSPDETLARHMAGWQADAPARLRPFLVRLARSMA